MWVWVHQAQLNITPPEGEIAFGAWDIARHVVRKLAGEANHWKDGIQRELHACQEEIYRRIPMEAFAGRYRERNVAGAAPSIFIILRKGKGPQTTNWLTNEAEIRQNLRQAIQSSAHHNSPFWRRDGEPAVRHAEAVDRLIQEIATSKLPKVLCVSGPLPLSSLANLIRDILNETQT